ncbi:MAG: hypothetical protein VYC17_02505 [Nitrospinota bacterium]|nr:hypothetical protein [Nitrospinota bacterium]
MKRNIAAEIYTQKDLISNLSKSSKPVSPENAIGRLLTRMEAINDRSVSKAALNAARTRLSRLEIALGKVDA